MGRSAPPDLMESLGFGPLKTDDDSYWTESFGPVHAHPNLWPEDGPELRRAVSEYWHSMEALSAWLMRIFALALDLDEDFFVRRSKRHVTNMRINYYPAQERPPEEGQLPRQLHRPEQSSTLPADDGRRPLARQDSRRPADQPKSRLGRR